MLQAARSTRIALLDVRGTLEMPVDQRKTAKARKLASIMLECMERATLLARHSLRLPQRHNPPSEQLNQSNATYMQSYL